MAGTPVLKCPNCRGALEYHVTIEMLDPPIGKIDTGYCGPCGRLFECVRQTGTYYQSTAWPPLCRECRQLYDVYLKVRRRAGAMAKVKFPGFFRPEIPPVVLRESTSRPATGQTPKLVWQKFTPMCPVDAKHKVEVWKEPGRCPRCGCFMEKGGFPFRSWD